MRIWAVPLTQTSNTVSRAHTHMHQKLAINLKTRTEERKKKKKASGSPKACCDHYVIFNCCDRKTFLSVIHLF